MRRRKLARPVIRPATRADLDKFYPPGKFKSTVTATVGLIRGKIIGCGGVAHVDGKTVAFCDFYPLARRYKVSIVRAAMKVIAEAKARHRVIYTELDPDEPGAERWVKSLGFEPTMQPRIFRWIAK